MSALAIALVLISALFHAIRSLLTKDSGDKQIFLWLYSIVALLFFFPLFCYFYFRIGITEPSAYAWCFGSGFFHFIYWLFLTNSYKTGDLSHVYPIMRSSPALVLIAAVLFLDEQVSIQGVCSILMVALGVYIINMKRISGDELLEPIKSITKDASTRFAFLTLLSVAAYSITVIIK
jgi:drug/metabolite transporter (DMT)-like permease